MFVATDALGATVFGAGVSVIEALRAGVGSGAFGNAPPVEELLVGELLGEASFVAVLLLLAVR